MILFNTKKRPLHRINAAVLAICLSVSVFPVSAFADEESNANANPIPFLTDENGYLAADEAEEISERLSDIYDETGYRTVIYTESELPYGYDDGEERARDLYYEYDDFDGMLFYISGDRYYHLLTVGRGYFLFGDDEISEIEEEILPCMRNDDMAEAFRLYAETAENILQNADLEEIDARYEEYMEEYGSGEMDDYDDGDSWWFTVVLVLLIPLIVALIAMGVKSAGMKTARAQSGAAEYLRKGSLNIKQQQDIFLYSTVTRAAKPEPDHNSGGSSGGGDRGPTGGHGGRF